MPKDDTKYFILSVDGGGIRGIIPLKILEAIANKIGNFNPRNFNLMTGTSTGGIIALGLNTPKPNANGVLYTIQDMLNLYSREGERIFVFHRYTMWDRLKSMLPVAGLAASIAFLFSGKNENSDIPWIDLMSKMFFWGALPTFISRFFLGLYSAYRVPDNRYKIMSEAVNISTSSAFRGALYTGMFYPLILYSGISSFSAESRGKYGLGIGAAVGLLYGILRKGSQKEGWFRIAYDIVRIPSLAFVAARYLANDFKNDIKYSFFATIILLLFRWIELNFNHVFTNTAKYQSPIPFLRERFGETRLGTLPTEVLVTSNNVRLNTPRLFTRTQDPHVPVFPAAAATSAAPTFFPQVIVDNDPHVDGGLGVNNPTLKAWNFFQTQHPDATPNNTVILSLGTGEIPAEEMNYLEIVQHSAINIIIKAFFKSFLGGNDVDLEMQRIFSNKMENYFRIQASLRNEISLDEATVARIAEIENIAQETINLNQEKINTFCHRMRR